MRLRTDLDGVELRALMPDDADAVVELMRTNTAHLTRNGDFAEQIDVASGDRARQYAAQQEQPLAFGIVEHGDLVGSVELVPVDPPRYGIGYWLAENATGRGLATAAVRTLVEHAFADLGATDVYAGVTHGNDASVAVLRRAGFTHVGDMGSYDRFHRSAARTPMPTTTPAASATGSHGFESHGTSNPA